MTIGFDASRAFTPQPTGTENYSLELLKALALIDKKNQYIIYTRGKATINLPGNFQLKQIKPDRFWTQIGLAKECLLHPPEILFIPAHTLPVVRRPTLLTVVTIHDLGAEFLPQAHTFPQKFYLNWSTEYAVKEAAALIAVSAATKKDLVEKLGTDTAKIFVVHEGVDKEKFKTRNTKRKTEEVLKKYKIENPYILFVGTVQPRKNLERLIEAFSRIIQNGGKASLLRSTEFRIQNLQLVIVGKKGWLYDEILKAPAKFGVVSKVKFLDYVNNNDLPAIYSQAAIFVLPSLIEGFGLPVLEAMAAEIPVVVSNRSSLPEVAGNAALYFNPENVEEISNAITKILTNQKIRQNLIEKGKKQVEKFSWEKTAKETLKVLETVYYRE